MPSALPPDFAALMARGVSVIVASRDQALRPSIMRAVGSRVDAGGEDITVYLSRPQSRQLLEDIAATGQIAVVFSEPATHRTVQVKATLVQVRGVEAEDAAVLAGYLHSMEREVGRVGIAAPLTRAMLAHRLEDVVAVRFRPEQAFDQSPGPRAGTPLGSGR